MPRFWKTYLAAGVLASLGAYIYFVESKREVNPEKPKEKLFTLDKSRVKELTLTPASGVPIRLVREGSSWKMAAPQTVDADPSEIDTLLSTLESAEIDEVVAENASNLGEFGLQPARLQAAVVVEGSGQPLRLWVGNKTPDGASVYAKLPQQSRILMVPSTLESALDKKPFDLRDRDLLHVKRDDVRSIDVTGPEGHYTLTREAGGEWMVSQPLKTRAGRWSIDSLLGTLESLRMESIVAEPATDLRAFGLAPASRRVVLTTQAGTVKTLEIGSSAGEKKFNAREASGALVAVIPGALVDDLAKGLGELRAKRLLDVATYEVNGFDVEAADAKRVYTRASHKDKEGIDVYTWKRTTPDGKDLDTNKVQDVLFQVGGVDVSEFVDKPGAPSVYGLEPPVLKVTLRYDGGKPAVWFALGRKDGVVYARRAEDDAVLKLDAAKAEALIKAFAEI